MGCVRHLGTLYQLNNKHLTVFASKLKSLLGNLGSVLVTTQENGRRRVCSRRVPP